MSELFAFHKLNKVGQAKAKRIADAFEYLLNTLEDNIGRGTSYNASDRAQSIMRSKLEEACFFSKKAMALKTENQDHD